MTKRSALDLALSSVMAIESTASWWLLNRDKLVGSRGDLITTYGLCGRAMMAWLTGTRSVVFFVGDMIRFIYSKPGSVSLCRMPKRAHTTGATSRTYS